MCVTNSWCPPFGYVIDHPSKTTVREQLGVSPIVPEGFQICSDDVFYAFAAMLDKYHKTCTMSRNSLSVMSVC